MSAKADMEGVDRVGIVLGPNCFAEWCLSATDPSALTQRSRIGR